jgi:hypothetical protein
MSDHDYEGALYERAGAAVVRANKLAEKTRKDFEKCVVLVVVYYCSLCRSVTSLAACDACILLFRGRGRRTPPGWREKRCRIRATRVLTHRDNLHTLSASAGYTHQCGEWHSTF